MFFVFVLYFPRSVLVLFSVFCIFVCIFYFFKILCEAFEKHTHFPKYEWPISENRPRCPCTILSISVFGIFFVFLYFTRFVLVLFSVFYIFVCILVRIVFYFVQGIRKNTHIFQNRNDRFQKIGHVVLVLFFVFCFFVYFPYFPRFSSYCFLYFVFLFVCMFFVFCARHSEKTRFPK